MQFIKDIVIGLVVMVIFVVGFISIADYHNRPNGFCDQVRENHAERMEYVDYQVFCK